MHTCNRWQNWCWSAGLAFALAGCGQTEVPKAPVALASAGVEPATNTPSTNTPSGQPAAKPATPASLEETLRAIDFRKFPKPDGAKDLSGASATILSCRLRKEDGAQAVEFYRTKFAEAGWKLTDGLVIKEKGYFAFTGSKQGFFLDGGVFKDEMTGEWGAYVTHRGNIDSRTLPRFAGAELKENDFDRTIYLTDAKPGEILEFMRTELKKRGWREVAFPRRDTGGKPDNTHTRFIQGAIEVYTRIEVKERKNEVWNQVQVLNVELPIMPETVGSVEFRDAWHHHELHLYYATPTGPEKVLEFYRKELPARGWTIRAGTDKIAYGKAEVLLDAPEKDSLRLELLANKDDTAVLITNAPQKNTVEPKPTLDPKIKPAVVTEKELRFEGKLANDSPKVMNKPAQIHAVTMSPDKTYLIDLESKDFDAYLRVLDSAGKQLASDDDGGEGLNARLRFTPPKEGNYQIVATRFSSGQGNYVLKIRVLGAGQEKQP